MSAQHPRHAPDATEDGMWQDLEQALVDSPASDRTDTAPDGKAGPMRQWIAAALVRAVKTAAQSALAAVPATAGTIGGVDWRIVAGTAALAAVMSVITSLAGIPEVQDGTSLPQLNK
jgi:hypothetical protein